MNQHSKWGRDPPEIQLTVFKKPRFVWCTNQPTIEGPSMPVRFALALILSIGLGCNESAVPGQPMQADGDLGAADMNTGSDSGVSDLEDGSFGDAAVVPEIDAEVEPEVDAEVEPEVDAEVVPELDAEVEPEVDAAAVPEIDAEVEPEDPIEALFAPPTAAERAQVRATWADWDVGVYDWAVLGEGELRGFRVAVVSHRVEGLIHYGAVRYPANYQPRNSYPVMILNHGGNNGVSVNTFGSVARDCYSNFFVIAASYRSEPLRAEPLDLGELRSEGTSSVIDRDVTDVIALLNGVLENIPGADEDRIVAQGGSRGAGVTGLLVVRDQRISRAGVLYGATDHMHPDIRSAVERARETGQNAGNPVNRTAMTHVEAYFDGELTLAEARQALIRSSVVYFAEDLPAPYQHHHGTEDRSVPVAQGRALAERMVELGIAPPDFEYTEYEGGEHSPNTMPGSREAIQSVLCGILD